MTQTDKTEQIAHLNDLCRKTLGAIGGRAVQTPGINALPETDQRRIHEAVKTFDAFTPGDDPYGQHDFGAFDDCGRRIYWKIDCYDRSLEYGSEDPSDPTQTTRVLTIMFAEEY